MKPVELIIFLFLIKQLKDIHNLWAQSLVGFLLLLL